VKNIFPTINNLPPELNETELNQFIDDFQHFQRPHKKSTKNFFEKGSFTPQISSNLSKQELVRWLFHYNKKSIAIHFRKQYFNFLNSQSEEWLNNEILQYLNKKPGL
jgi:hypothetical protein